MTQIKVPAKGEIEETLGLTRARKSRSRRQRWMWIVLVLALVAAGYFVWQRHSAATRAITYDTAPITRTDVTVKVAATGTIAPVTEVDISSPLSGIIKEVDVEENASVKKGDVLAVLDQTRLATQRAGSAAKLAVAQAAAATAQSTLAEQSQILERQKTLAKSGLAATQTLDSATADVARAQAAIQSANAAVASAQADLATVDADITNSVIVSPIDGMVLKRAVEPGNTVASSLQAPVLFQIAGDLKELQLNANIDEADIGQVKEGQSATFNVDAYRDRQFPAKIQRISFSPVTVDGVVTYTSILSAPNPDLALRPGMTATAYVTTAAYPQELTVPNEALRYKPPARASQRSFSITNLFMPRGPRDRSAGKNLTKADAGPQIYVLRDGAPVAVPVTLGASDGKVTIVKGDGLKEGDLVITAQKQAGSAAQ